MLASSALTFSSFQTNLPFNLCNSTSHSKPLQISTFLTQKRTKAAEFCGQNRIFLRPSRLAALLPPSFAVAEALEQAPISPPPVPQKKGKPLKLDKNGRFCSPRAARELALLIAYAACLDGSDPVRLFDKRVNAQRCEDFFDPGFVFDKASLLEYDHMNFGGPPIATETEEEAEELLRKCDEESAVEEDVLSAPPKLNEPAGRILEICILHLAMAEITKIGTRHQIVINEAVDLAKRFCDGTAPRVINGCLRTFIKDLSAKGSLQK
ncbi:hypothetical protein ACLOJK_005765 [Asimina triloba]